MNPLRKLHESGQAIWLDFLAYIVGLERRRDAGEPIDAVASVASFFVSRGHGRRCHLPERSPLRGKIAVANAKAALPPIPLQLLQRAIAAAGGCRRVSSGPLWASTGIKNPAYSDVLYVEEFVGPDTVDTMPEQTLHAFRDHGRVRPFALFDGLGEAEQMLALLPELLDESAAGGESEGSQPERRNDDIEDVLDQTGDDHEGRKFKGLRGWAGKPLHPP